METIPGSGNWKLTIRREAAGITILRAATCDARARLPETLYGLPVTALGDHALSPTAASAEGEDLLVTCGTGTDPGTWSNRDLEDLTLPRSLERVGLASKGKNLPSQLSGGQQQRVSIARALVGEPAVILADEPTGALDSKTGREVLSLLQELHAAGNTVVLITHDNSIAVQAQRIIRLEDGRVVYDGPSNAPEAVVTPRAAGTGGGASA